jgi:MFS superfamily sulfate permease-like transporter
MDKREPHEDHHLLHRCSNTNYTSASGHADHRAQISDHKPTAMSPLSRLRHGQQPGKTRRSGYLPALKWLPEYQWDWLPGDVVGALTVASLYVPLSISFALLGHAHPISGLYSFVVNPLIYALLGTCPMMVVGPEAPGSLLVGTIVTASLSADTGSDDDLLRAQIAGTATTCTGIILFMAGVSRLGYLNSVLSRPLMRGVIGALGLNVLIEQTITGLGLADLARNNPGVAGGSPARRLVFILANLNQTHMLTAILFLTSFAFVMILRCVSGLSC